MRLHPLQPVDTGDHGHVARLEEVQHGLQLLPAFSFETRNCAESTPPQVAQARLLLSHALPPDEPAAPPHIADGIRDALAGRAAVLARNEFRAQSAFLPHPWGNLLVTGFFVAHLDGGIQLARNQPPADPKSKLLIRNMFHGSRLHS
jgi:hypothetical protein